MSTKTRSALAELERLEQARDDAHAAARTAREPLTRWEREHFGLPLSERPAELETAWVQACDDFHAADTAVRRYCVDNAQDLIAELVPDRDQASAGVLDALDAIRGYRGAEHQVQHALKRVGLSGADMVSDRRVDQLASALDLFDDLDTITAPYSRSAETPEGAIPLFRPNDDRDGWISWKAVA